MDNDYISRQEALKAVCNACGVIPELNRETCQYTFTGRKEYNNLCNLPSADVRPVVRGRWYKPRGMMPPEFAGRHRCSICEEIAMLDWKRHREVLTPYCPNCGADMREGDDAE